MPQYSGAHYHTTFSASSRTELADAIKDAMVAAGWSVVSGASGDWKLESAATDNGLQVRARVYDPGSGTEALVYLLNVAESVVLSDVSVPALTHDDGSETWHFYGNPYFCIAQVLPFTAGLKQACWGTGWTPDFFHDSSPDECIASAFQHYYHDGFFATNYGAPHFAALWNNVKTGNNVGSLDVGEPIIVFPRQTVAAVALQWAVNDSYHISDPLIAWSSSAHNESTQQRIRLQLYDCVWVAGNWNAGDEITWDGYVWRALTDTYAEGSLFVIKEAAA